MRSKHRDTAETKQCSRMEGKPLYMMFGIEAHRPGISVDVPYNLLITKRFWIHRHLSSYTLLFCVVFYHYLVQNYTIQSNLHGIPGDVVGYVFRISIDVATDVFPGLEEVVTDERKNMK